VQWTDVTRVNGIWVKKSIAGRVQSLVNAAAAAGFQLTGGGYRDPNEQIRFRTANCGPTYYDIYQKPASQCIPPTAPPGLSMHEQGLAIDFISNGSIISKRSNPAYVWLSNNAAKYGLYNLPSEPWHWSSNGK
jgi:LAS superfamily LD-carboxypeptidase LdcB